MKRSFCDGGSIGERFGSSFVRRLTFCLAHVGVRCFARRQNSAESRRTSANGGRFVPQIRSCPICRAQNDGCPPMDFARIAGDSTKMIMRTERRHGCRFAWMCGEKIRLLGGQKFDGTFKVGVNVFNGNFCREFLSSWRFTERSFDSSDVRITVTENCHDSYNF